MSPIGADFSGRLAKICEIRGKKRLEKNIQKPTLNSST
jgi:hypothetical protein